MTSEHEQDGGGTVLDRRAFLGLTALAAGSLGVGATSQARAQSSRADRGATVRTSSGRVSGFRSGSVLGFKGIPYGEATDGERRFRRPVARVPWTGVRRCLELGPRSPQFQNAVVHEFGVMNPAEPSSEDCLCLNLWTPDLDAGKRPVMVWLHGGGYSAASAGWSCYDGTNLAANHDVVVVGVNHRLNLFGYLHLAELRQSRFEEASNLGMLDIVLALEWVRDNIEGFGGDPENVTIFGQSGGAGKVSTLLGMPKAQGLFHKAIVQSGSAVRSLTPGEAGQTVDAFLAALGLTRRTAERIVELPYYALRDAIPGGRFSFAPVVDGVTLPDHVFDPRASEIATAVPMMIGSTETEVTWSTSQQYDPLDTRALRDHVQAELGCDAAAAAEVIDLYRRNRPTASGLDLYLLIATDAAGFRTDTDTQAARKAAAGGADVYKYYFQWYSPVRGGQLRAMHCMDIPFVFDNLEIATAVVGDPAAAQPLADQMAGAWTAFARSGNPTHRGLADWPAFDNDRKATMVFNVESRVVDDPYGAEKAAVARASGAAS
jgi:para-nitrobenzyl esterase